jgi:hypothetical protein
MLHVFKGEILANMTQVSDVAPGPLVLFFFGSLKLNISLTIHSTSLIKLFDLINYTCYKITKKNIMLELHQLLHQIYRKIVNFVGR